ncbi:ThuA domain-containing protein [Winogradskya humida]|uniref:Glycosyl hydrolase n=1 Tax=Winogradskya humida TaxID=113566 RepID=A0ABQ3ZRR7_9ACTN|nr:ThuA domain-containing protein [Actinoplanes humidus]GIE21260.1 glycosyl hydrolase [Actinoplanes humidus]
MLSFPAAALLTAALFVVPHQAPDADPADYQQVTLAKGVDEVGEPMAIAVLPDRSVLHTARNGALRRTDANGTTTLVGTLPVYQHDEEGLQGVGVDPGFATNRQIYLYYAPPLTTPGGDAPATGSDWSAWQGVNRLSRYALNADFTLDAASKVDVLDVPADRGLCCHVGGDIDFDAAGNLYLSTGDDSNPFDSAGYAPIDERADRNPAYDAQRSAGNTNDLRGKVLRIKVGADGSYTIPDGNLFAEGTAKTRPEIYAMGFRNPFRMSVDKATGVVYLGDYGPDAGATDPARGPGGQVEFNRITSAGNYGWPYCTGANTNSETYNEWDFDTGTSGAKYDCAGGPVNNSFRNTGLETLPAARPAWIKYGGDSGTPPEFGGGSESPMGGPVYHFDPALDSPTKFPQSFDGHFFAAEFGRGWIKPIDVAADGSPGEISAFPWVGKQVMDMAFGPEGSLYVLDYGTGYFNGDANSALYRFDYLAGSNRAPTAAAAANVTNGQAPLTVEFSSAGSSDPEGGPLTYSWDFGDGTTSTEANPAKTYTAEGTPTAVLTVTDAEGLTGTSSVTITVGNTAPTVTVNAPANGALFSYGDTVPFDITVTDPEDDSIDCTKVTMTYVLGHDSHGHQITSQNGCTGEITIPVDGEHDSAANIFAIFDAQYTDSGGLTTHTQHTLQPRHRQAEHYKASSGVDPISKTQAEGGRTVGNVDNGDWVSFEPYRLDTATSFTARVSSGGAGGTLQFRTGSPTGTIIGSATVPVTGSWETFIDVTGPISGAPASTGPLYLTFAGGSGALFDVDSFTLNSGDEPGVLVFSKTAGFRHDSIAAGVQAIKELGGFAVTATEDAAAFTTANLANYDAVVFLNTTGDVLNADQQTAFESYIRGGGGYVGVHAAADTEYDWPFYGDLVGAWFDSHPAIQPADVVVEDRAHAATAHLPQRWNRTDEWYNYRTNPRSTAHVLASLDEGTYTGGGMGADHPHAWCKTLDDGRSFYTGGGHTIESYADPAFRTHLLGGLRYAAGQTNADCRPETGYTTLYNGTTTGWSQAGPGGFTNTDATLSSTGGLGLYWYETKEFTDYSLKLDWKLAGDDNSGVFLGFPASDDPWSAVNNGYEVQIDATDADDRTTGSVYTFKAADLAARDAALNPPGEWNTYELRVESERLQVFLNGVKINDFTNTDPARSLAGHIGLQNHGDGDNASFRNVRIKEL